MSKKMTHTEAFAHFGTTPRNVRWSWSARNEDTKTVVGTLWQDQFERRDGRLVYAKPGRDPAAPKTPAYNERIENLAWARDHCGGCFHVIIAKAKDVKAVTRSIEECFPAKMVMRLTRFDPETGEFVAEVESSSADAGA